MLFWLDAFRRLAWRWMTLKPTGPRDGRDPSHSSADRWALLLRRCGFLKLTVTDCPAEVASVKLDLGGSRTGS